MQEIAIYNVPLQSPTGEETLKAQWVKGGKPEKEHIIETDLLGTPGGPIP